MKRDISQPRVPKGSPNGGQFGHVTHSKRAVLPSRAPSPGMTSVMEMEGELYRDARYASIMTAGVDKSEVLRLLDDPDTDVSTRRACAMYPDPSVARYAFEHDPDVTVKAFAMRNPAVDPDEFVGLDDGGGEEAYLITLMLAVSDQHPAID